MRIARRDHPDEVVLSAEDAPGPVHGAFYHDLFLTELIPCSAAVDSDLIMQTTEEMICGEADEKTDARILGAPVLGAFQMHGGAVEDLPLIVNNGAGHPVVAHHIAGQMEQGDIGGGKNDADIVRTGTAGPDQLSLVIVPWDHGTTSHAAGWPDGGVQESIASLDPEVGLGTEGLPRDGAGPPAICQGHGHGLLRGGIDGIDQGKASSSSRIIHHSADRHSLQGRRDSGRMRDIPHRDRRGRAEGRIYRARGASSQGTVQQGGDGTAAEIEVGVQGVIPLPPPGAEGNTVGGPRG